VAATVNSTGWPAHTVWAVGSEVIVGAAPRERAAGVEVTLPQPFVTTTV